MMPLRSAAQLVTLLTEERQGPEVDPADALPYASGRWEPHPRQRLAMESIADELFFGGARGGGKSDWLIADFAAYAQEYGAAARGALFRRTIDQFRELRVKGSAILHGIAEWHQNEKTGTSRTAPLLMSFLDTMDDVANYMGHEYSWLGFDELTDMPSGEPYEFMTTCVRSKHDIPKYIRATGNPGRPGHLWVKAYFVDKVAPGDIYLDADTKRTRQYIPVEADRQPAPDSKTTTTSTPCAL